MLHKEVTKSNYALVMLIDAVMQLIQTSAAFNHDLEKEMLRYHRKRQTETLTQLHEVLQMKLKAVSAHQSDTPSNEEIEETKQLEASIQKAVVRLLNQAATASTTADGEKEPQPEIVMHTKLTEEEHHLQDPNAAVSTTQEEKKMSPLHAEVKEIESNAPPNKSFNNSISSLYNPNCPKKPSKSSRKEKR